MVRPALVLGAAAAAALAPLAPHALLTKLLKTPIGNAELPRGFTHARLEKQAVSANGRKYHAVGLVAAALAGPDPEDALAWVVFPSHAGAVGDLDHPALGHGIQVVNTVPGITESLVLTGRLGGKKITDAAAVVGNVLVQGVVVASSERQPAAVLLLRAAMAHLARARS